MIKEVAMLTIDPAKAADFEAAVAKAAPFFKSAPGCHGMSLERVIETPGSYALVVQWATLEAHIVDFRGSDNFQQWRALAGPFFTQPPHVAHTEVAANYF